jgi:hypothetical protein
MEEIESGDYTGPTKNGASILAIPVVDTVKQVTRNIIDATLAREHTRSGSDPQAFRDRDPARRFWSGAKKDEYYGTDEASLVERIGRPVSIVRGSERNIKNYASCGSSSAGESPFRRGTSFKVNVRVGIGFDLHRLGTGHSTGVGRRCCSAPSWIDRPLGRRRSSATP